MENHLKKAMNFVTDEAQTDNATIAFEVFHSIDGSHSKIATHMALKHDMSKAFDKVEWHFLEILM